MVLHRAVGQYPCNGPNTVMDEFAPLRPKAPIEHISAGTRAWLTTLPPTLGLTQLETRYPRILNRTASCWSDFSRCEQYLRGLLTENRRGTRTGFPYTIAVEILALHQLKLEEMSVSLIDLISSSNLTT